MKARLENIYYFCNVKSNERHDVAARSSVFCVLNLLVNSKRNECGSSNARKVSAHLNLTARIALSLCQNK
jgi:hypothetical protein